MFWTVSILIWKTILDRLEQFLHVVSFIDMFIEVSIYQTFPKTISFRLSTCSLQCIFGIYWLVSCEIIFTLKNPAKLTASLQAGGR